MRHLLRQLMSAIQCRHAQTTFPQTAVKGQTRVVCLSCGASFEYDARAWKRGKRVG
jgi:hypothetical protein